MPLRLQGSTRSRKDEVLLLILHVYSLTTNLLFQTLNLSRFPRSNSSHSTNQTNRLPILIVHWPPISIFTNIRRISSNRNRQNLWFAIINSTALIRSTILTDIIVWESVSTTIEALLMHNARVVVADGVLVVGCWAKWIWSDITVEQGASVEGSGETRNDCQFLWSQVLAKGTSAARKDILGARFREYLILKLEDGVGDYAFHSSPLCLRITVESLCRVIVVDLIDVILHVIFENVSAHDCGVVGRENAERFTLGVLDDEGSPWLTVDLPLSLQGAADIVEGVGCHTRNVIDFAISGGQSDRQW